MLSCSFIRKRSYTKRLQTIYFAGCDSQTQESPRILLRRQSGLRGLLFRLKCLTLVVGGRSGKGGAGLLKISVDRKGLPDSTGSNAIGNSSIVGQFLSALRTIEPRSATSVSG